MSLFTDPHVLLALATLTALEIVLGIDNIVFIAILAGKLPVHLQSRGRIVGLGGAMVTRILLLLSLTWIMRLTAPVFTLFAEEISGRDLILLGGGLFLLSKSTFEIHESLEGQDPHADKEAEDRKVSFIGVIIQIMLLDMVFSLDSVITAIGLTEHLYVMILAIIIAVFFMMFLSGAISKFVETHPTIKMLALSFLLLIGLALIGESFDMHIPKGYIYFAMGFSIFVELLNLKLKKPKCSQEPLKLRRKGASLTKR